MADLLSLVFTVLTGVDFWTCVLGGVCGRTVWKPAWIDRCLAMRQAGSRARVVGQTNSVEEVALLANEVGGTHVGLASFESAHA